MKPASGQLAEQALDPFISNEKRKGRNLSFAVTAAISVTKPQMAKLNPTASESGLVRWANTSQDSRRDNKFGRPSNLNDRILGGVINKKACS